MTEKKRYASIKKVDLSDVSEGYDSECYAYVVPANFKEREEIVKAISNTEATNAEQLKVQEDFIRGHYISGKGKFFDGESFTLDELTLDDVLNAPDLSNKLLADIMGWDLDPKAISKAVQDAALQQPGQKATETPSSEA